jgi:hypothetical protein
MDFDPYETWLGIPADRRPPTYYDLLGLASDESNPETIEQAALRRMRKVRLHQIGPHSDLSQEVLDELGRARLILKDPHRRADYDAKLRARGNRRPSPSSLAPETIETGDAPRQRPGPDEGVADLLGSLVLTEQEGNAPLTLRTNPKKASSSGKRGLAFRTFLVIAAVLVAAVGALFYFHTGPGISNPELSAVVWNDPTGKPKPSPPPAAKPELSRLPPATPKTKSSAPSDSRPVAQRRTDTPDRAGTLVPESANLPAQADFVEPKLPIEAISKIKPAPAAKKNGKASPKMDTSSVAKKTGRTEKTADLVLSLDPPRQLTVKPVFFVPQGEAGPTQEQIGSLNDHLKWCCRDYRKMLGDRDTFMLDDGVRPLVYHSPIRLAEFKAASEMCAPQITGELLAATNFNRFNCPFVFVAIVMNPGGNFPAEPSVVAGPFNGGLNAGGGIALLPSFALDKLSHFQSILQHVLGHAFGLRHVADYGGDMRNGGSIMSQNLSHRTRGMEPSPNPGRLGPEDLRGLSFNRRAFPKLVFDPVRDVPAGYTLKDIITLDPIPLVLSLDPPRQLTVKPVFFVPQGEAGPTQEQIGSLNDHLKWCCRDYRKMLGDRDTFMLDDGVRPLVHHSPIRLAELKAASETCAPRITGELLAATNFNRFNCRFVFVAVVMNPGGYFPAEPSVVAGPFNGSLNSGGGIALLSSSALDKLPHFQSNLQHLLGQAFGLPHVRRYGGDMPNGGSIMSHNLSHHTRGMEPSPTPGRLGPEDLRSLSFNFRAFPKFKFIPARHVPAGYTLKDIFTLDPMPIDGQPAYEIKIETDSGETYETKISNIVHNRILPSNGGHFDRRFMWHSDERPNGLVRARVTFPVQVTLAGIGVHSQHSGRANAADALRVWARTNNGVRGVIDCALQDTDVHRIPFEPTPAQVWDIEFHAQNNKSVTLRGLRFYTKNGEIFPPLVLLGE